MKTPKFANFMAVATVVAAFSGCGPPPQEPPQPPKVTVANPVRQDVVDSAEFSGTLETTKRQEIRARVKGFLDEVLFKDGDDVEQGQKLFVIEQLPYQARLAAEQAKLEQAQARLKLAHAMLDRAQKLLPSRAISAEEVNVREAEAAVAAAEVTGSAAAVADAKINLGYTEINALISGRIDRRLVDKGNLVGGLEQTLLTTIVNLDQLYAYFDVSESIIHRHLKLRKERGDVDREATVYLGFPEEDDFPYRGELEFIENQIDPSTGTALARGLFDNEDGLLYPGRFVRLRIPLEPLEGAVLVREVAIGTDLAGKYLLLVGENDVVEKRHVELGPLTGLMRVIRKVTTPDAEQLTPQDRYIVKGLQFARPGLPVRPEMAAQPAPGPSAEATPEPSPEPLPEPLPE